MTPTCPVRKRRVIFRPTGLALAIALARSVRIVSAAWTKFNDLQISARRGLVSEEKELAPAYLTGNGVSPDVPGMYSPGAPLLHRAELAKSPEKPLCLLETAANAGSWKSSFLLGIPTRDNRIVPRHPEAAYRHFQGAILQAGEPAKRLLTNELDSFGSKPAVEQRSTLVANANSWSHDHGFSQAFLHMDGKTWTGFAFPPTESLNEDVPAGEFFALPPALGAGGTQEGN